MVQELWTFRNLLNMAGHSRLTVDDIASFCAGKSLSD